MAHRLRRWFYASLCLAFLAGCVPQPVYRAGDPERKSRPKETPRSTKRSSDRSYRTGKPPKVLPPRTNAHPVDPARIDTSRAYQIGVASYYGKAFHGRKTASGEVFNMYRLTAAHRVLPLGTRIKVTNLSNGRWVVVKVNDRGPFVEGRILDLSFAAALELEMVKAGTARVMIEIVEPVR